MLVNKKRVDLQLQTISLPYVTMYGFLVTRIYRIHGKIAGKSTLYLFTNIDLKERK